MWVFLSLSDDEVNVWEEGPDSEKNIRFDSRHPNLVVGATFNKLVERVTSEKDHGVCVCMRERDRERESLL